MNTGSKYLIVPFNSHGCNLKYLLVQLREVPLIAAPHCGGATR